jgi:hypothetical protein
MSPQTFPFCEATIAECEPSVAAWALQPPIIVRVDVDDRCFGMFRRVLSESFKYAANSLVNRAEFEESFDVTVWAIDAGMPVSSLHRFVVQHDNELCPAFGAQQAEIAETIPFEHALGHLGRRVVE